MTKPYIAALILGFLLTGIASSVNAKPNATIIVVTTLPVLEDYVKQIGREHVTVTSLISGLENGHNYALKPSDILEVRQAHMFVTIGAGLEIWANQLVKIAQNHSLEIVVASKGIALLRNTGTIPTTHTKHALGNPHVWLDPENAKSIVRQITTRLIKLDRSNQRTYLDNQAEYLRTLDTLQTNIKHRVKKLSDRRFVSYHPAWPYFARRFGFKIAGNIIEQPEAEPSAKHLSALAQYIKKERIKVIVSEPQLNQKIPRILAEETGAHVVILTANPGALPGTDTYTKMLQFNVSVLIKMLTH
tara:strand:- start:4262 stop:5167 length:906 start_codon:yes stop_codon:yes gene_type:complete